MNKKEHTIAAATTAATKDRALAATPLERRQDSKQGGKDGNGVDKAVEALTRAGAAHLADDRLLDALAFFDGALLQFGPAGAKPDLLAARDAVLDRLGRASNAPLPIAGPSPAGDALGVCRLCGDTMYFFEHVYDKNWLCCPTCSFIQYWPDKEEAARLDQGEPAGAKQPEGSLVHNREEFFCNLFLDGLGWSRVLLYGAGWSLVPQILLQRGVDAVGCDLFGPLIAARRSQLGSDRYYHRDELPARRFDLITCFEVFEHFLDPVQDVGFLVRRLADEGAIVGCTDFWHGSALALHPGDPTYWRHRTHVTAWTFASMRRLAMTFGLRATFFKVDRQNCGSKIFFMLSRGRKVNAFIEALPTVIRDAF